MPSRSPIDLPADLMEDVREVAREAGDLALRFFRSGLATSARIWSKAGGSPVTEADVAVDAFLKVKLSRLLPAAAWLSEETADDFRRIDRDLVWIVDPIDGTRAYLAGSHDWSIDAGLVSSGSRDWDIAAADLILAEAGGLLTDLDGARPRYNRQEPLHGELVAGPAKLHAGLIAAMGKS